MFKKTFLTNNGPDIINWAKCVVCQNDTSENLKCPMSTNTNEKGTGYLSLTNNLKQFNEIDSLPFELNIDNLDDGSGIVETLKRKNAKYHKSCFLKFNDTMLKRVKMKKKMKKM